MNPSEKIKQIYNNAMNRGQKILMSEAIMIYLDQKALEKPLEVTIIDITEIKKEE